MSMWRSALLLLLVAVAAAPAAEAAPAPAASITRVVLDRVEVAGRQSLEISNEDGQIAAWILEEEQYLDRTTEKPEPYRFVGDISKESKKGIFLPPLLEVEVGGVLTHGEYTKQEEGLRFVDPASDVVITRKWSPGKQAYTFDHTIKLENPGTKPVPYDLRAVLRGAQDPEEASVGMLSQPVLLFNSVCATKGDLERAPLSTIIDDLKDKDDPTSWDAEVTWAGVDNRYFMTSVSAEKIERCSFDRGAKPARFAGTLPAGYDLVVAHVDFPGGVIPPGGSVERKVQFYGGPKRLADLRALAPSQSSAIDFGFFSPISLPMLAIMKAFHGFTSNWGIAIILLTLLVKLLTLPLTHKQYKSMAAMKLLQPQLKGLQEKYKDDKMKLQQEMMGLYKEHKVNPLAGCLPAILMMPIYIALYRTIYSAVELYQASFFGWITDLSAKDPYFITPLVLGVLMFAQTRINPSTGDEMQQKIMMTVMPIMFTGMMMVLPSGLVLYILVNTALGLGQQVYLLKREAEGQALPAKRVA